MRFIKLDNNKVISIREGVSIVEGEIQSDLGELGQIMQANGSFINDPTPIIPQPVQPTNKEINDNLMVIMNGIVDIYMAQLGV